MESEWVEPLKKMLSEIWKHVLISTRHENIVLQLLNQNKQQQHYFIILKK